jgi:hypothetical protein
VRSFKNFDTYYLSGYVKAFHIHGDGEPLLLFLEDGLSKGINVVMKRDIALDPRFKGKILENQYFDLSTPYGYGGWLFEGAPTKLMLSEYEWWANKNNIVCEFVRFHPVLQNQKGLENYYEVVKLGQVITLDLSSPEVIFENITSKNRNMIRKAEKSGVNIYQARCPEVFRDFKAIYNSTMDKDNADSYYYFDDNFYSSILNDLPEHAIVFFAKLGDKTIASSIMIMSNGMMDYHLSGSLREYSSLAPTNLILYKAALWGSANGYKTLYLGGGVGSEQDSLFNFKKSFYRGDDLKSFFIGKKIFSREKYDFLVSQREQLVESSFFPKYRS